MSKKPFKILGIEHIGIAVDDLNGISDVFCDVLGLKLSSREKIDDQQVITDIYQAGSGKLEFLKATDINSPIDGKITNKVFLDIFSYSFQSFLIMSYAN